MKIGIIVFSHTGNTYSVGMKLRDMLQTAGHDASLERVKVEGKYSPGNTANLTIESAPDPSGYEAIIFGAPVHAFSLCQPMKKYMTTIKSLKEKKCLCFVTQAFPFAWMGGNRAVNQLKKRCGNKQGTVLSIGVVNWGNPSRREAMIDRLVHEFKGLLS